MSVRIDLAPLFTRRAALLRELADLDERIGAALTEALRPEIPDEVFGLEAAAAFMGEKASTFRQRLEYRKAMISRQNERRLRFSRRALERIKADRLAAIR